MAFFCLLFVHFNEVSFDLNVKIVICYRVFMEVRKKRIIVTLIVSALLIAIIIGIILGLYYGTKQEQNKNDLNGFRFGRAAVVTTSAKCASIGVNIMQRGGSVADSAIATLLCEGVFNPHSMGLGGGFVLTIYDHRTESVEVLNARETIPEAANQNMLTNIKKIKRRGLLVAVPGELQGYWELHRKYGKLPWYDLFAPTIKICHNGILVSKETANVFQNLKNKIMSSSVLKLMFLNPKTGDLYQEGEYMKRSRLGSTLEFVARNGPDVLYNGILSDDFILDLEAEGEIITRSDLKSYRSQWQFPIQTNLPHDLIVYTTPPPASGSILLFILQMATRLWSSKKISINWFYLIEIWKFAFAYKTTLDNTNQNYHYSFFIGYNDSLLLKIFKMENTSKNIDFYLNFFEENICNDHGSCHVSIYGPNGDAVSVTSSINTHFGAFFASASTGIILNNQMINLLNTQSWSKIQPFSSMCPTIITNKKNGTVKVIVGASGGSQIITALSIVLLQNLYYKTPLKTAVENKRLHYQLDTMTLWYEDGFPEEILTSLSEKGHEMNMLIDYYMEEQSSVNIIKIDNKRVFGYPDSRRNGSARGF